MKDSGSLQGTDYDRLITYPDTWKELHNLISRVSVIRCGRGHGRLTVSTKLHEINQDFFDVGPSLIQRSPAVHDVTQASQGVAMLIQAPGGISERHLEFVQPGKLGRCLNEALMPLRRAPRYNPGHITLRNQQDRFTPCLGCHVLLPFDPDATIPKEIQHMDTAKAGHFRQTRPPHHIGYES